MLFSKLFLRCPKTGRIRGLNPKAWPKWTLLLSGIAATVWYLVRVVPKPSRAAYPCQRAAFPIMTGFLVYVGSLAGSVFAYRKARTLFKNKKLLYGMLFLLVSAVSLFVFILNDAQPVSAANPVGTAQGIFPGRVAWVHNPNAAMWRGTGNYWASNVNPQAEYDKAFTAGIECLSGGTDDATSWDRIFRWFNNAHGRAGTGYQAGDTIAIKINQNNDSIPAADVGNRSNANPQSCVAVVRSLVNAGVPQAEIYIGDPSRAVSDNIFNAVHTPYPNVKVVDYFGNNGRALGTAFQTGAFPGGDGGVKNQESLCFYHARYIVNMPLLKGHVGQGITFGSKNFFGVTGITPVWQNNGGHPGNVSLATFMTNANFGGKVVLWCMDAMYPNVNLDGTPNPNWAEAPFNGLPASSFFMSLDGVAEESVSFDFFYQHYAAEVDANSGYAGAHVYMQNAATATPSGGTHEHWNSNALRQYSRNIDPINGLGIELVYINAGTAAVEYADAKAGMPRSLDIAGCEGAAVKITLPRAGEFRLTIYTLAGNKAGEIAGDAGSAGINIVSVKSCGLPPGAYLMRLTSHGAQVVRQVRVVK